MKKISILSSSLLIFFALFSSCHDVQFTSPQPAWVQKNETTFPKNLRGNYTCHELTLKITEKEIMDNKNSHDIYFILSDSVLLRKYDNYYFLNLFQGTGDQRTWSIIMAKEEEKKVLYYRLKLDNSEMINRLKEITKVQITLDSITGEISDCLINPTPDEFRKMIAGNLFTIPDTLIRIK